MAKKKQLNNDKSQTVWQYIWADEYNRIHTSESKFFTMEAAGKYFKTRQKEGLLQGAKLVGYNPTFQSIYVKE